MTAFQPWVVTFFAKIFFDNSNPPSVSCQLQDMETDLLKWFQFQKRPKIPKPTSPIVHKKVQPSKLFQCCWHQIFHLNSKYIPCWVVTQQALSTSVSLRMLHLRGATSPSLPISSAAPVTLSSFLLAITTLAPRVSSSSVMAFPIPVPPPVTMATFPENRPGLKTDISENERRCMHFVENDTSLHFSGSEILSKQKQFSRLFPAALWFHFPHCGVEPGDGKNTDWNFTILIN